jgi:hypothetical protein
LYAEEPLTYLMVSCSKKGENLTALCTVKGNKETMVRLEHPCDHDDVMRLVDSLPQQSSVKGLMLPPAALVLRNIDEMENLINAGRLVQVVKIWTSYTIHTVSCATLDKIYQM